MTEPKQLLVGANCPSFTQEEQTQRIATLNATIEKYFAAFKKAVQEAKTGANKGREIIHHQEAFAAGYHDDEYTLLGMAIKYCMLNGVAITIAGYPDTNGFLFRLIVA